MSDMASLLRILSQMQQPAPGIKMTDYAGQAAQGGSQANGGQSLQDIINRPASQPMATGAIPGIQTPQGGFSGGTAAGKGGGSGGLASLAKLFI